MSEQSLNNSLHNSLNKTRILRGLERLDLAFAERDAVVTGVFSARLTALRSVLVHGRRPRIMVCGRRGAGKSSLLNALLNDQHAKTGAVEDTTLVAQSFVISLGEHEFEWIDSPGLSAGNASEQRADSLAEMLLNYPPEVLVFLHPASEVDAGIDAELSSLASAFNAVRNEKLRLPFLLAVATKVDELEPLADHTPPYSDAEKLQNIARSVRVLRAAFERHALRPHTVLAANTWFSDDADLRWNLDLLEKTVISLAGDPPRTRLVAELKTLYRRLGTACVESFLSLAEKRGEEALLRVMIERLRAVGPVAVHADEQSERLKHGRTPGNWLRKTMASLGAAQLSNAIQRASFRAAGESTVDQWMAATDGDFANLLDDPIDPLLPLQHKSKK